MSSTLQPPGTTAAPAAGERAAAPLGVVLAIVLVLALATSIVIDAALVLASHPSGMVAVGLGDQNQGAKTAAYLVSFALVLPLAIVAGPSLVDRLGARIGERALTGLAALLGISAAVDLVLVRLLPHVGVHDGLRALLALIGVWWVGTGLVLAGAWRGRGVRALERVAASSSWTGPLGLIALLAVVLCLTDLGGLTAVVLAAGAGLAAVAAGTFGRARLFPRAPAAASRVGVAVDLAVCLLLLLAVPNVVIFHTGGIPNNFFPPGIIQFHQDWLLGPANQLLGGGALLVNVPVSQYGVGFIYFLAAWFHIAPIGYGTYGILDGLVTALFYVSAYGLLRIVGVRRAVALGALALAVVTFVYHLYYGIGALPQQGPLRFGLPLALIVAEAAALHWPAVHGPLRALGLLVLGAAAIWSLEMLIYTSATYLVLLAFRVWLEPGERRRHLVRGVGFALAAIAAAHLLLALWTVAATGHLPDWGQYLTYVDALVLGNTPAGQISYGFAPWSPALAVGAGSLASAVAVALCLRRAPGLVRADPVRFLALAGLSAYAVLLFSYTDNRSSTYLLPYVSLPLLLAAVLWLTLRAQSAAARRFRAGAAWLAAAVACVMVAAAWPTVGSEFSDSALGHAYPGGGLRAALHRLWHPPPIDPRAPAGQELLARYVPGHRALVVLPDLPDLGTEILMRSRRSSPLFIGDPKADGFIDASEWTGKLTAELAALTPGAYALTDGAGLRIAAQLRGRPESVPLDHPIGQGNNPQLEWILQRLADRFRLVPVARTAGGLVLVRLAR